MIATLCWIAEFLLESSGAVLAWRKRLWTLFSLLAFRALADVLTFLILLKFGGNAYGVADWIGHAVQYVLLCALACQICRKLLRQHSEVWGHAGIVVAIGSGLIAFLFYRGETLLHRFLDSAISASMLLGILMILGWIYRKGALDKLWEGITAGFIVAVASDALCAFLWTFWADAPKLYPAGAILNLMIWNWAARPKVRMREARLPLPSKKPPTSVICPHQSRRWVN